MSPVLQDLSLVDLAIAALLVLINGAVSMLLRLDLERRLLWAALRTVLQLLAVGYVLGWVFAYDRWYVVLALMVAMTLIAGVSGSQRGAWRYAEHDWIATPGSIVYETAGSRHTPITVEGHGDETVTLNITSGDLIYFDGEGRMAAIENWRTAVQRYLDYCTQHGIEPRDVTHFGE